MAQGQIFQSSQFLDENVQLQQTFNVDQDQKIKEKEAPKVIQSSSINDSLFIIDSQPDEQIIQNLQQAQLLEEELQERDQDKIDFQKSKKQSLRYFATSCLQIYCHRCGEVGHKVAKCQEEKPCLYCGQKGHNAFDCPKIICYICQEIGHKAQDCSKKKQKLMKCNFCSSIGHKARHCLQDRQPFIASQISLLSCLICQKLGHCNCYVPSKKSISDSTYCCQCAEEDHVLEDCQYQMMNYQNDQYRRENSRLVKKQSSLNEIQQSKSNYIKDYSKGNFKRKRTLSPSPIKNKVDREDYQNQQSKKKPKIKEAFKEQKSNNLYKKQKMNNEKFIYRQGSNNDTESQNLENMKKEFNSFNHKYKSDVKKAMKHLQKFQQKDQNEQYQKQNANNLKLKLDPLYENWDLANSKLQYKLKKKYEKKVYKKAQKEIKRKEKKKKSKKESQKKKVQKRKDS